jgi:hypothetical protein
VRPVETKTTSGTRPRRSSVTENRSVSPQRSGSGARRRNLARRTRTGQNTGAPFLNQSPFWVGRPDVTDQDLPPADSCLWQGSCPTGGWSISISDYSDLSGDEHASEFQIF